MKNLGEDKELYRLLKILWNYELLKQKLEKSDALLVLGSHDITVPVKAADLYRKGFAPLLIFTGGLGKITKSIWKQSEARVFAEIATKLGVPKKVIIIEDKSTTTAENMKNTLLLINKKKLNLRSFIIVTKPYMERRVYGMFKKQWADKRIIVTSPKVGIQKYFKEIGLNKNEVISLIVGDVQRVMIFPKLGYSIRQVVPDTVKGAFKKLISMGYDKYLLAD